jgi:ABC-type branched-subunit amino acid transport system substrate-binding protein
MLRRVWLAAGLAAIALAALPIEQASAQGCTVKIGLVMELTGPAAPYGQAGAKAVEMAFRDINDAGGVLGCKLVADLRDSQSQGTVAVDAARQLVDVEHVPAIIGGIISSITLPILTSVTAPAKIVQISPASSSPTLTELGREGKTNGIFFRTITTDALQGIAAAKYANELGFKKLAIIYVNNDFGVNMERQFASAYKATGGTIVSATPYNEKQSSYQAEVTAAMAGSLDALYLISYPVDGATIARTWISQGGVDKFLLNDGMNSDDFINAVGARYLNNAYGTSSGTEPTPSTTYFDQAFKSYSGIDPDAPAADRSYDAGAILGLAVAQAGKPDSAAIRDAIRKVLNPAGTPIYAGAPQFTKALALIKAGKPIRYIGVIGPVQFDPYGDISGPFRLWKIASGKVVTTGELTTAQIDQIKASMH